MTDEHPTTEAQPVDVVVIGSGVAGLTAALTAAASELTVLVLEKDAMVGGTSAMSGGGVWVPANHVARAEGVADSPEEALDYLESSLPAAWGGTDRPLWRAFVAHAPEMLEFVERNTPLTFATTHEPDPMAENPGGKARGRMVSPRPLPKRVAGPFADRLRPSTLPHLFSYQEMLLNDPYHRPVRAAFGLAPQLLWRLLTGRRGQGTALMAGLVRGCLDRSVRIETRARVTALDKGHDGRVTGVRYEHDGATVACTAGRAVVIATGGYEWDEAWRKAHFPGPFDRIGSPRSNTGDGQKLAASAGAMLDRLDQANVFPTLPTVYEGELHGMPALYQMDPHAIVVNRNGERFASEYDYNIGEALDRRDPETGEPVHLPAWLIADRRMIARSRPLQWYARKDAGWMRKAGSIAELARGVDLPADVLEATVARFNGFCAAGRDADFRRGESLWERSKSGGPAGALGGIEQAPFYAFPFNRSLLGTKGGARTNERGQVLDTEGAVILGLYCAGNAMANPFGTRAVGAGTTLGPCMTWGYICARSLVN